MNKKKMWALWSAVIIALSVLVLSTNSALEVNEYDISGNGIPQCFSGFRIAQISDLHNAEFGERNSELMEFLSQADPDVIVITGDLIDSRHTDLDIALEFCGSAVNIAPVYYVTGNHEARVKAYQDLKTGLEEVGVTVLENNKVRIEKGGEYITLMGIKDPRFITDYLLGDADRVARQAITSLQNASDGYTLLLSHRPELFDIYVESGINLVFSGHAHGGQFRLPVIGGLLAPNQGFFPEYDAGMFTEENTTMVVSRGVGNSIIPFRINNPPEIVVVELRKI